VDGDTITVDGKGGQLEFKRAEAKSGAKAAGPA
jgi:hypothetical protein